MTRFNNQQKRRRGLSRLWHATRYSLQGLVATWRSEAAFRTEVLLGLVMLPAAWLLGRNLTEVLWLIGSVLLVLVAELLNSAIESLADHVSLEQHELIGRAKDMGSAAVFLTLLFCGGAWATLLLIRIVEV